MTVAKCKKHPRYQAKRQPFTACSACWQIWHSAKQVEDKGKK